MKTEWCFIHIPKNAGTAIIETIKSRRIPINYTNHDVDITYAYTNNHTIVVIRNPIDRFCSAVRYALQKWVENPTIQKITKVGLTSPESWIQVMKNRDHPFYNLLMEELLNDGSHHIGNKSHKFKYIYTPQCEWIHSDQAPDCVLLFDSIDSEFPKLVHAITNRHATLLSVNETTKKHNDNLLLSEESIEFLKKMYQQDFDMWNKYSKMVFTDRCRLPTRRRPLTRQ